MVLALFYLSTRHLHDKFIFIIWIRLSYQERSFARLEIMIASSLQLSVITFQTYSIREKKADLTIRKVKRTFS